LTVVSFTNLLVVVIIIVLNLKENILTTLGSKGPVVKISKIKSSPVPTNLSCSKTALLLLSLFYYCDAYSSPANLLAGIKGTYF